MEEDRYAFSIEMNFDFIGDAHIGTDEEAMIRDQFEKEIYPNVYKIVEDVIKNKTQMIYNTSIISYGIRGND